MSPVRSVVQAVRSWLRRRGGPKTPQRAVATVEQLDHRRLLAVNFTGIVTTDFPESQSPGVVVLRSGPGDQIATPDTDLQGLIATSGFAVNAIRLSYDPTDDSLSFGLEQPLSGRGTGLPVIAGDADDNGNEATVDPAVLAITPSFRDPADLDGFETMAVFLDLNEDGVPDIVAGKPQVPLESPKLYHVAIAANTPGSLRPDFGPILPNNTGNLYLVNDPRHPGFEFEITNFRQLYEAFNPDVELTPESVISVGAYAGSLTDGSVSETFINLKPFTFGDSVLPPPDCECPPVSPPILVNPHELRHINTAHATLVRVYVYGSSGFDVDNIVNETVELGGASPIFAYNRRINADPYSDRVFVFRGNEISLPPGFTLATLSGELVDGTEFVSQIPVYNRDLSSYPGSQMLIGGPRQHGSQVMIGLRPALPNRPRVTVVEQSATTPAASALPSRADLIDRALRSRALLGNRAAASVGSESVTPTGPVVRIPLRPTASNQGATPVVPRVRFDTLGARPMMQSPIRVITPAAASTGLGGGR